MAWIATTAIAADLACADPVQRAELDAALSDAEARYTALDDAGFRNSISEIAGVLLPCTAEALPAALAARTHVVMALHLSMIGDDTNAALSLAAARAAQPDLVVAPGLIPDAHPLRILLDETTAPLPTRRVPEPREGSVAFDGTHTRLRPREQPTIAQLFDETGLARSTHYLAPREPMPGYRAVPRQRNLLLGCTGGAAALATGAYAWSWGARGSLVSSSLDPGTPGAELDRRRSSINALAILSGTFIGAAATCGVGAVVVGEQ